MVQNLMDFQYQTAVELDPDWQKFMPNVNSAYQQSTMEEVLLTIFFFFFLVLSLICFYIQKTNDIPGNFLNVGNSSVIPSCCVTFAVIWVRWKGPHGRIRDVRLIATQSLQRSAPRTG